jgi:hypothetical protein
MLTYNVTIDSSSQQFDDVWKVVGVADYSNAIIRLSGTWDGPVSFWGDNTPDLTVPLAVQDISGTNWTTAAISEAGASPSAEVKIFRAPVSGLTRIGIYGDIFGEAPNLFSGIVDITITLTSDSNAR